MDNQVRSGSAALHSLRVIDLSDLIAGPFCTKMFAAQGAKVIKVERPGCGDPSRTLGPFPGDVPHPEKGGLYLFLNMGKLGVTLDWRSPEGKELLLRLASEADVLVESSVPGTLERLGLGYEVLRKANPNLVVASVSAFGQSGPYKGYKATEIVLHALSGEMYLTGDLDKPPLMKGGNLAQFHGGIHAFIAIMSALHAREALGEGQYIDVSMAEGWASIAGMFLKSYTYKNEVPMRAGVRDDFPGGLRRCKDGWVVVSGRGERRPWWPNFVDMLDVAELRDERFSTADGRSTHKAELEAIFHDWLMRHTKEEVYHKAQSNRLVGGYVCDAEDLLESPQLASRRYFQEVDHPVAEGYVFPSMPFRSDTTPWINRRAPLLAEHNEEVFCGLLGLAAEELAALRSRKLI